MSVSSSASPASLDLRESVVRVAAVLALVGGVVYLGWRLLATVPGAAPWFALPVWAAEVYGWLAAAAFFFVAWAPRTPGAVPAPSDRTADVFVVAGDEPAWMVRRALLGAQAMRRTGEVFLVDRGRRSDLALVGQDLGCRYVAGGNGGWGKGDALNLAFGQSRAVFVAIFDADHVPVPDLLTRTLGYFDDATVAFVQTGLDFYNTDSFQHRSRMEGRPSWHEETLRFQVVQPGRDRWNAAVLAGSCAVLRRRALEEAGGFAPDVPVEDYHTSIRLHARGWRSVYHNEVLAYGLAPVSAAPYHRERLRLGEGALRVLWRLNPLRLPGLSPAQRLCYLQGLIAPFAGYQKLIFYLTPPVTLLTGVLPVRAVDGTLLLAVAASYGALALAYKLAARGHGLLVRTAHAEMLRFFTRVQSTAALLPLRRRAAPVVADTGTLAMPQLAVGGLTAAGLFVGTVRVGAAPDPTLLTAFLAALMWSAWHLWLATWAMWFTLTKVERRERYRVPVTIPVRYSTEEGHVGVGVLADLHEEGGAVLVPRASLDADRVWIQFLWIDDSIAITGDVAHQRPTPDGLHVGLRFRAVPQAVQDFLATFSILFAQRTFASAAPVDWLGAGRWWANRRLAPRVRRHFPLRVYLDGREVWAVTLDVSESGALLLLPLALPVGTTVRFSRWRSPVVHEARVMREEAVHLAPYTLHRVGVRIEKVRLQAVLEQPQPLVAGSVSAS